MLLHVLKLHDLPDDGEMAVTDGVLVDFHSNPQEPSQRVGISLT